MASSRSTIPRRASRAPGDVVRLVGVQLGPTTIANTIYHRTIPLGLVVGLVLFQMPAAKAALGRR
jgi:hypothetical protein